MIKPRKNRRHGFLLLETMFGVLIFAVGVLAMARSLEQCIVALQLKNNALRARSALENRMLEIEAGSVSIERETLEEKLQNQFSGMTLRQTRKRCPLKVKEVEKDQPLDGVHLIELRVSWPGANGKTVSRELSFYVYQPR